MPRALSRTSLSSSDWVTICETAFRAASRLSWYTRRFLSASCDWKKRTTRPPTRTMLAVSMVASAGTGEKRTMRGIIMAVETARAISPPPTPKAKAA